MGIFEKRRMKKFMEFIGRYNESDPTTHQGIIFQLIILNYRTQLGQRYYGPSLRKIRS